MNDNWPAIIGVILTGIAGVVAAYSTFIAKRTENKTLSQETLDKALNAQNTIIDRQEKKIKDLENKNETLEKKYDSLEDKHQKTLAIVLELEYKEKLCQERVANLEAKYGIS